MGVERGMDWLGEYDPGMDHLRSDHERTELLVRALLAVERQRKWSEHGGGSWKCVGCGGYASCEPECIVDAALTAAGLPDQASRDEARKAIAEMKR